MCPSISPHRPRSAGPLVCAYQTASPSAFRPPHVGIAARQAHGPLSSCGSAHARNPATTARLSQ
eukprot:12611090-Alexandrium_andersonii.AAC.1